MPVIQMPASHAVMQAFNFNSRFQGQDVAMERNKGELKYRI